MQNLRRLAALLSLASLFFISSCTHPTAPDISFEQDTSPVVYNKGELEGLGGDDPDAADTDADDSQDDDQLNTFDPVPLIAVEPGQYILRLASNGNLRGVVEGADAELLLDIDDTYAVIGSVLDPTPLENNPDVEAFEPNQNVTVGDGQDVTIGFYEGIIFQANSLTPNLGLQGLGLPEIHMVARGEAVTVGVVDTGADASHPLLENRCILPTAESGLGWDDLPNYIDDDNDDEIDEAYGHGTFVAGVIAQVAPGSLIAPVRALNSDGVGSLADIIAAVQYLAEMNVDVINLSLSLSQPSPIFEGLMQEVQGQGITVVAAAGNQSTLTSIPAAYESVVGVAATNPEHNRLASFSNYGKDCDLAAPGMALKSAFPKNRLGYGAGTSFASPIVAGAVALKYDESKSSPAQATNALRQTAREFEPVMYGHVDIVAAVLNIVGQGLR